MKVASRQRAFTLLEAVLALVILSGVLIVTLQMRVSSIAQVRDLDDVCATQRNSDVIFESLLAGTIGKPTIDAETGARVWLGVHLGEPFTVRAASVVLPNPVREDTRLAERSPVVQMMQYEIEFQGRTDRILWHR